MSASASQRRGRRHEYRARRDGGVSPSNGGRFGAVGYSADILGFSQSAFALLRDLICQRAGVFYGDDKRDLLGDKLSALVAAHGMTSFLDYYYLLRYDALADRHWAELMDHLAVPETYFWRQPEQILALASAVAPRHFERHPGRTLRIWSAACCTGEEPISLAIALAEAGWLDAGSVELVGSDASPTMLASAREGLFGERSFRNLADDLRHKYFRREGHRWRVDPQLHQRIRWTTANLVDEADVRPLATVDVIFCRNVFIYFSDAAIKRSVQLFAEGIRDGGHLFLGASESLARLDTAFDLAEVAGAFVYVKRAAR